MVRIPVKELRVVGSFAEEFKAFAFKGNMIDLAVGVVIGTAFGKVIDSIVKNVITPLISYVMPQSDFSNVVIGRVKIGLFLNDVISFLIISLAVFIIIVKLVGYLMRQREKPKSEQPPPLTTQELLLTEIRGLLKNHTPPESDQP